MPTSKLGRALRARFPGPGGHKRVAQILGIDAALIANAAPDPAVNGSGESESDDRLNELRTAIEAALSEAAKSNKVHDSLRSEILEILKRAVPSSVTAGDSETDEERHKKFRQFLRSQGLAEDDITKACDIVARVGKARDQMPANGLEGGAGGARSGKNVDRLQTRIAADERRLDRKFGVARIIGERRDADHSSIATGPSRRQVDRTFKKYPGIELIGRV